MASDYGYMYMEHKLWKLTGRLPIIPLIVARDRIGSCHLLSITVNRDQSYCNRQSGPSIISAVEATVASSPLHSHLSAFLHSPSPCSSPTPAEHTTAFLDPHTLSLPPRRQTPRTRPERARPGSPPPSPAGPAPRRGSRCTRAAARYAA